MISVYIPKIQNKQLQKLLKLKLEKNRGVLVNRVQNMDIVDEDVFGMKLNLLIKETWKDIETAWAKRMSPERRDRKIWRNAQDQKRTFLRKRTNHNQKWLNGIRNEKACNLEGIIFDKLPSVDRGFEFGWRIYFETIKNDIHNNRKQ